VSVSVSLLKTAHSPSLAVSLFTFSRKTENVREFYSCQGTADDNDDDDVFGAMPVFTGVVCRDILLVELLYCSPA